MCPPYYNPPPFKRGDKLLHTNISTGVQTVVTCSHRAAVTWGAHIYEVIWPDGSRSGEVSDRMTKVTK